MERRVANNVFEEGIIDADRVAAPRHTLGGPRARPETPTVPSVWKWVEKIQVVFSGRPR